MYTGDVIAGKQVVTALDVEDLEPGQKHLLYFQGVQTPAGQHHYVSVMVAKGAQPGPRVALISGVHGDEISSIRTVQRVMEQLDPAEMSGTVLAVFDVSRPALIDHAAAVAQHRSRLWPDRRQPRMARQRERQHGLVPTRGAGLQSAPCAER